MQTTLLTGSRKGLLVYSREAAGNWVLAGHHFAGKPVSALLARGDCWHVALREGHFGPKLHRSMDAGATWTECAAPAFPADLADKPVVDQAWSLAAGQDGVLWAGCIPAGLFRSLDNGLSWTLVESLWNRPERAKWFGGGFDAAGIHSILVDPRAAQRMVLGISCGGVWLTDDGGENWQKRTSGMWAAYMPPESKDDSDIQDPHRLAQCLAEPDTFWCQHHNGQFLSRNALNDWQEVKPLAPLSNFGFAVAVHPSDPLTAWFVPAQADQQRIPRDGEFYVLRTRDGGQTYEKLHAGLPAAPAFHLVYRHALDVDDSGNRLAMASTTGSLWISEDGGDAWQRLSAELPPVYCLTFA